MVTCRHYLMLSPWALDVIGCDICLIRASLFEMIRSAESSVSDFSTKFWCSALNFGAKYRPIEIDCMHVRFGGSRRISNLLQTITVSV